MQNSTTNTEQNSLELVYSAFSNLERNYSHSKKTREEYIKDKFGGDIDIGSTIILDALNSSTYESDKEIAMVSYIKDLFERILARKNALAGIIDFSFTEDSLALTLTNALHQGQPNKATVVLLEQSELYRSQKVLHYHANAGQLLATPLDACRVFYIYNPAIQALISQAFSHTSDIKMGAYYAVRQGRIVEEIPEHRVTKELSATSPAPASTK